MAIQTKREGYGLSMPKLLKAINIKWIHAFNIFNVTQRCEYSHLTVAQKTIRIAHSRSSASRILKYMSSQAILDVYQRIPSVLNNTTLKGQARKSVSQFFTRKLKLPISKRIFFRLPSIKGTSKRKIRHTIMSYVKRLRIPKAQK